MKLVHLRGSCPDRVTCPNLYATDRGTYVVQGYARDDAGVGSASVEVPRSLLPEAAHDHADLRLLGHDSVLVRGSRVTDPDAVAVLNLPEGEAAIEIGRDVVPGLVGAY